MARSSATWRSGAGAGTAARYGAVVAKLNQIIAVEKGVKSRTQADLAAVQHGLTKPALLAGLSRTYQPKDEEGEQLPPESTRVQVKAEDVLRETDMSPGDFVRTCKQLLDLLRQIEEVAPEGVADLVRRAREAVNRGVVAYTGV